MLPRLLAVLLLFPKALGAADADPFAAMKPLYKKIELQVEGSLKKEDYAGAVAAMRSFTKEATDTTALSFLLDLQASYLCTVGDYGGAILSMARAQNIGGRASSARDFGPPWDAVRKEIRWEEPEDVLRKAAEKHSVILMSEAHHVPEHRAFGARMLPLLRRLGFEYLAMEALSHPVPERGKLIRRFPSEDAVAGYYLMEPQMAGLVRTARRLGFKLVAYEDETAGGDREKIQAENLVARVFKDKPDAKVVVWAGYGHVYKRSPAPDWKWMGQWLWELTGREPFSVYQVSDALDEHLTDEPYYRPLVKDDPKRPKRVLALTNRKGLFPALDAIAGNGLDRGADGAPAVDAYFIHPPFERSAPGSLRPGWLSRTGRVRIEGEIQGGPASTLIQAFPLEEGTGATPSDQMFPDAGGRFELWLEEGRYLFAARGQEGLIRAKIEAVARPDARVSLSLE